MTEPGLQLMESDTTARVLKILVLIYDSTSHFLSAYYGPGFVLQISHALNSFTILPPKTKTLEAHAVTVPILHIRKHRI